MAEFYELEDVLYSDKMLRGTVVNAVRDEYGKPVEYWVELHDGADGVLGHVVFASAEDLHPVS